MWASAALHTCTWHTHLWSGVFLVCRVVCACFVLPWHPVNEGQHCALHLPWQQRACNTHKAHCETQYTVALGERGMQWHHCKQTQLFEPESIPFHVGIKDSPVWFLGISTTHFMVSGNLHYSLYGFWESPLLTFSLLWIPAMWCTPVPVGVGVVTLAFHTSWPTQSSACLYNLTLYLLHWWVRLLGDMSDRGLRACLCACAYMLMCPCIFCTAKLVLIHTVHVVA